MKTEDLRQIARKRHQSYDVQFLKFSRDKTIPKKTKDLQWKGKAS